MPLAAPPSPPPLLLPLAFGGFTSVLTVGCPPAVALVTVGEAGRHYGLCAMT